MNGLLLTPEEIAAATRGVWKPTPPEGDIRSVSTDTREVRPGDLFVALRGERFDAHRFLDQALERGAAGLVVENGKGSGLDAPRLPVDDTLVALGDIASAWRAKCPALRMAVVGSTGKTTTKEMLHAILSLGGSALASEGNYNNLIGLPLTLFRLERDHRWAVLELGMNQPGELRRLTEIAAPDYLLLLSVGMAHVGMFDSQRDLVEAKADAVRGLGPGAPIIYDRSSSNTRWIVEHYGEERPRISFAVEESAEVWARNIRSSFPEGHSFDLELGGSRRPAEIKAFGRYNVKNAVAAAAGAYALGVSPDSIVEGLRRFRPAAMRSEMREVGGVTMVLDCYNSNPDSLKAALEDFERWRKRSGRRLLLVLGDMFELGEKGARWHKELGRLASRARADRLYLTGDLSKEGRTSWRGPEEAAGHYGSKEYLADQLTREVRPGDVVFFKASRGIGLETVARRLEESLKAGARS